MLAHLTNLTKFSSFIKASSFLLFTICSISTTNAQQGNDQAPDQAQREARGRVAYVIYTGHSEIFQNPIITRSGNQNKIIQLSKRTASPPVKVRADNIVQFVTETPENPKMPFTPYAVAKIPEGTQKALIILTPIREPKNGILFSAKVQDLGQFKNGDWLFINKTPRIIAVNMGKTKLQIQPLKTAQFNAGVLDKPKNLVTSYGYYHPTKKKWKLLSASTVVVRPTRREICVFSWNAKSQKVDYHGITLAEPAGNIAP